MRAAVLMERHLRTAIEIAAAIAGLDTGVLLDYASCSGYFTGEVSDTQTSAGRS